MLTARLPAVHILVTATRCTHSSVLTHRVLTLLSSYPLSTHPTQPLNRQTIMKTLPPATSLAEGNTNFLHTTKRFTSHVDLCLE